jgi:protease I
MKATSVARGELAIPCGRAGGAAGYQCRSSAMAQHRGQLDGISVAILVSDLFEQAELAEPKKALEEAGARTAIISDKGLQVHGMKHEKLGDTFDVDVPLEKAQPEACDALVLPGGTFNADALRMVPLARQFVRAIESSGKPIGVICHGPWLLVSEGLVKGRTMTSWPSVQDDIRNAGGSWVDREVVVDGNWISSRKPDDLPAFNRELIAAIAKAAAATRARTAKHA